MTLTKIILGLLIGGGLGALLGYYGKCTSGACPLTATPLRGLMIGAVIGLMIGCASNTNTETAGNKTSEKHIKSEEDFNTRVLNAKGLVLVDFYADWCAPCRKLAPVIDKFAADNKGKVVVVKVDVDKHADLSKTYKVKGIPHIALFKEGKVVEKKVGYDSKAADVFNGWLKKHAPSEEKKEDGKEQPKSN